MLILRLKKSFAFVSQAQSWLRMVCLAQVSKCVVYCKHVGQKCGPKAVVQTVKHPESAVHSFLNLASVEYCLLSCWCMLQSYFARIQPHQCWGLEHWAAVLLCSTGYVWHPEQIWAESNFMPVCADVQSLLWNPESLLTERIFQLNLLKFQPSSQKGKKKEGRWRKIWFLWIWTFKVKFSETVKNSVQDFPEKN